MKQGDNLSWKEISLTMETDMKNLILKYNKHYSKDIIGERFEEELR